MNTLHNTIVGRRPPSSRKSASQACYWPDILPSGARPISPAFAFFQPRAIPISSIIRCGRTNCSSSMGAGTRRLRMNWRGLVNPMDKILGLLTNILRESSSRKEVVKEFERYYHGIGVVVRRSIRHDVLDILDELVCDLGFYVADPAVRAQDPSYFGDERLVREVESTLRLLSQAGIIVPQEGQ